MKITEYTVSGAPARLTLAVAADLHGNPHTKVLDALEKHRPDLILIPGDLMEDSDLRDPDARGYAFLTRCAQIAPTFYSLGNHEIGCYHKGNPWRKPMPVSLTDDTRRRIEETGAVLLDNSCVPFRKLTICGLTSGICGKKNEPDADTLKAFDAATGYRVLLCHHPEYYAPFIKKTGIELTVAGHAHGGHWRVFGQGIYAPGQGLFPRYTSGMRENRLIISRGLGNHTWIPRIFNEPELLLIHLKKEL